MKRKKAIVHGECYLFESSIPKDAVQETNTGEFVIIADSETTGNHHVIDLKPGVSFFKKGNRRFVQCKEDTAVRCVLTERHDTVPLKKGTYEIGIQQEYDYFTEALRNVRD